MNKALQYIYEIDDVQKYVLFSIIDTEKLSFHQVFIDVQSSNIAIHKKLLILFWIISVDIQKHKDFHEEYLLFLAQCIDNYQSISQSFPKLESHLDIIFSNRPDSIDVVTLIHGTDLFGIKLLLQYYRRIIGVYVPKGETLQKLRQGLTKLVLEGNITQLTRTFYCGWDDRRLFVDYGFSFTEVYELLLEIKRKGGETDIYGMIDIIQSMPLDLIQKGISCMSDDAFAYWISIITKKLNSVNLEWFDDGLSKNKQFILSVALNKVFFGKKDTFDFLEFYYQKQLLSPEYKHIFGGLWNIEYGLSFISKNKINIFQHPSFAHYIIQSIFESKELFLLKYLQDLFPYFLKEGYEVYEKILRNFVLGNNKKILSFHSIDFIELLLKEIYLQMGGEKFINFIENTQIIPLLILNNSGGLVIRTLIQNPNSIEELSYHNIECIILRVYMPYICARQNTMYIDESLKGLANRNQKTRFILKRTQKWWINHFVGYEQTYFRQKLWIVSLFPINIYHWIRYIFE